MRMTMVLATVWKEEVFMVYFEQKTNDKVQLQ